jgi:hypothetical protein
VDGDEESEQDGVLVCVKGMAGHRGWRRCGRAGRPHQRTVRGLHTGQVERAIWGHVDIVQALVMDPAGRPRAGFCDGSRVVDYF